MTKTRKTIDPAALRGRKRAAGYFIFYLLFSPDFWRFLIGVGAAAWLAPRIVEPEMTVLVRSMLYLMLTAIGWAASGVPARWICEKLKRLVLGNRVPPAR